MSIALTASQTRFLRGQAHDLKALLQTGGKGVTPAFIAELNEVLERHELVKVKVAGEDRVEEPVLGAVPAVHLRLVDPGCCRDAVHARARDAVGGELGRGRLHQPLAAALPVSHRSTLP